MGVVPALQLGYVTGESQRFCFPDPSLNISRRHPLARSLAPEALGEKGNRNKFRSATSPYFLLPPLSLSLSSCSISLSPASLFSPTQPLSTSVLLPPRSISLPPPSLSSSLLQVRAVMALKDACDVIQTDCGGLSGMLLGSSPLSPPVHLHACLHPAVSAHTPPPLCLTSNPIVV